MKSLHHKAHSDARKCFFFFFAIIPLFEKGENIKTPLTYDTYFKINNNLDNLKFFEAVHEPTCTTVTSLYISKNSVFIPPHKHSNTIISKRNAHSSRAREKKKRPN